MSDRLYDISFSIFLFSVALVALIASLSWPFETFLLPRTLIFSILALLIIYLVTLHTPLQNTAVPDLTGRPNAPRDEEDTADLTNLPVRPTVEISGWIVFFSLSVWLAGFQIGLPPAAFLYLMRWSEKWAALPISLGIAGGIWLLDNLFALPFPRGMIFQLLG